MPYHPPADASPKVKAFAAYVNALSALDLPTALSYCDDQTFEMQLLPLALGRPALNKGQYEEFMKTTVLATFETLEITVFSVLESGDDAITVHAKSDSVSKLGTPWHNEYIFIIHFTPGENPKMTKYQEFMHTAFVAAFRAEEMKKKEALAGAA
ncbi:hypothetical protein BDZ89DRAFT_1063884 [Hymenopellis radicata]|nr:hypothetical protein BDZ89DRAFT_1063884 [Hymenopellis radicata]